MEEKKRYAWIVKETGKVAAIRDDDKLPADRKDTMEVVEVDDEVESGMWRQGDGSYAMGPDDKAAKKATGKKTDGDETADPAKLAPRDAVTPERAKEAGLEPMKPGQEERARRYASPSVTGKADTKGKGKR